MKQTKVTDYCCRVQLAISCHEWKLHGLDSYVGLENLTVLAVEHGFDASILTTVFNGF